MKAIVSFSGGMDSATLLHSVLNQGYEVYPVSFVYGSKHNHWESNAGKHFLREMNSRYPDKLNYQRCFDLYGVFSDFKSDLLKSGGEIPEGHYESASMSRTVVPGRNTIFTSILMGLAESIGVEEVLLGIHAGDHAIYPDCRPVWLRDMGLVFNWASEGKVRLKAPYIHAKKNDIVGIGIGLDTPYHLTRTCYKDQQVACGKCGSCQERLEAFKLNGKEDPLRYEAREPLPKR